MESFHPAGPGVLGAQQASFRAALPSPHCRAGPACPGTLPRPRPHTPARRPGTGWGVQAHLQLTGAPLAAATAAVARPLRGDETAQPVNLLGQAGVQLLEGVGWSVQGCRDAHTRPPPPGGPRPTWLWRSSSWPSCWQRLSVCSRSSACRVRAPISRHFCEYCSDSTCSSRFSASTSDLPG